jgi:hypothetical protein
VRVEERDVFGPIPARRSGSPLSAVIGRIDDGPRPLDKLCTLGRGGAAGLQPSELDGKRIRIYAHDVPPSKEPFDENCAAATERVEHDPACRRQPLDEPTGGVWVHARWVTVKPMNVCACGGAVIACVHVE